MLDNVHSDTQNTIRVIIFREGDLWVAQCVEYDIGAQAPSLGELTRKLDLTIEAEVRESLRRHGVPFKGIPRAPAQTEEMWNRQVGSFKPAPNFSSHLREGVELALCA